MKKLILFTIFSVFAQVAGAKTDTAKYWSYASRIYEGTTNEIKAIKADNQGNVYYTGHGSEIIPGNRHALIVGKMNDTISYVWKKKFFGTPSGSHQILVDDNSVYITGEYNVALEFPNDTFTTPAGQYRTFFLCLDASNGNVRWVRNLELKEAVKLHFDSNNDLVLAYAAYNGIQSYDGQNLDTISNTNNLVRGYAYLTLNKANGKSKKPFLWRK